MVSANVALIDEGKVTPIIFLQIISSQFPRAFFELVPIILQLEWMIKDKRINTLVVKF